MKKLLALSLLLMAFVTVESLGQDKKPASPKETVEGTIDGAKVTIVYHRPSVKGRKVMGDLVPFGQVWRTGANDATTITFDKAVTIEGKALAQVLIVYLLFRQKMNGQSFSTAKRNNGALINTTIRMMYCVSM